MNNKNQEQFIYGYTKQVHELAELYINREILKCDTSLIEELLNMDDASNIGLNFNYDMIEYPFNYPDIVDLPEDEQAILKKYSLDPSDIYHFLNQEVSSEEEIIPHKDASLLESIMEDYDEPETKEIFEWWSVTAWLGEKLNDMGEAVLKNDYGYWWGRTCTGQAIILDGTIQKIALQYVGDGD